MNALTINNLATPAEKMSDENPPVPAPRKKKKGIAKISIPDEELEKLGKALERKNPIFKGMGEHVLRKRIGDILSVGVSNWDLHGDSKVRTESELE